MDGVKVPLELISENDGLSKNEFIDWFKPAFKRVEKENGSSNFIEIRVCSYSLY